MSMSQHIETSAVAPSVQAKDPDITKQVVLGKEKEFRFEVEFGNKVTIKLLEGTAENFGTELAQDVDYIFTGIKSAIFSYHGCTLEVSGTYHSYIAEETPMTFYLNLQTQFEEKRTQAQNSAKRGPRVLIAGPTDSGKTTLSKILLNYAARKGRECLFVDLDIGQGSISVPGMLAAISVSEPIPPGQPDLSQSAPLIYFFGHVTPSDNIKLFKTQLSNIANDVNLRLAKQPKSLSSGLIINTCGWIEGDGYELLTYSIDKMEADFVLVMDNDRLFSELSNEYQTKNKNVRVLKIPKSGGVVTRPPQFRRKSRMEKIKEYFYGINQELSPHQTILDFRAIKMYRIGGGPLAPSSALPIGAESTIDPIRLVETVPTSDLLHSIIAVSHAKSADKLLTSNVAGFLYVTEINVERQKLTVLAPCPGPLPSQFLLVGTLKWLE